MQLISHEETWFSTPIWECKVGGIDNEQLKKYCYQLEDGTKGVNISNRGGWHSSEILPPIPKDLEKLLLHLEIFVNENCFKHIGVKDLKLGNFWININYPNCYNILHDHQNSILSGVYYVSVPSEDMGDLILHRGDSAEYFLKSNVKKITTKTNSLTVTKKPVESVFYIFPSWIKHHVELNNSKENRISIAFNFVVESI